MDDRFFYDGGGGGGPLGPEFCGPPPGGRFPPDFFPGGPGFNPLGEWLLYAQKVNKISYM